MTSQTSNKHGTIMHPNSKSHDTQTITCMLHNDCMVINFTC